MNWSLLTGIVGILLSIPATIVAILEIKKRVPNPFRFSRLRNLLGCHTESSENTLPPIVIRRPLPIEG